MPDFDSKTLFAASTTIRSKAISPTRSMAAIATWPVEARRFPGVRYDFRDVMEKPNQAYAFRRLACRAVQRGKDRTDGPPSASQGCRHRRSRLDRIDPRYEMARTGLEVVAIERGPWRDTATDFI